MKAQQARQDRWELPPEGSAEEITWARDRARRATRTVLIPFVLALVIGVGIRVERTWEAADIIAGLAETVAEVKIEGTSQTAAVVKQVVGELGGQTPDTGTLGYLPALVRTLADQVPEEGFDPQTLRRETFFELLWANTLFTAGLLAILVLFFPALFIAMYFHAATAIVRESPLAPGRFRSFTDAVWYRRHRRFLAQQGQSFFWRRFAFALLIALGANYFFAPAGLTPSVVGEYTALHPLPGEASHAFWLQHFKHAPPYVIGFAGFYLYALTGFLHRFTTWDLNQRMLVSLLNRGITVMILSLVLSSVTQGDNISRALIFAAGVFPQTGLQALAKMGQTTVDRLAADTSSGFRELPEIDIWRETSLAELGIFSIHELARADLRYLVESVGITPDVLVRAADRALLLHVFGSERARALEGIPAYTASELVLYVRGVEAYAERWRSAGVSPLYEIASRLTDAEAAERSQIAAKAISAQDISLQIAQLETDRNIMFFIDNKLSYGNL
ncbi:MAG: hypothetical protein HYY85_02610 [Deltaproteobacteria bacterium]|nr:hypothetical protein [Deltaproteobacteria bacterium]